MAYIIFITSRYLLFLNARWAQDIVDGLSTWCAVDQTKKLSETIASESVKCLDKIIKSNCTLGEMDFTGGTCKSVRTTICCSLLRVTSTAAVFPIVCNILTSDKPSNLKDAASQIVSQLCSTDKEGMKNYGNELMSLVATGDYDTLIYTFLSLPELYENNPSCINDNLEVVMRFPYMNVSSLYMKVSQSFPEKLVPHVEFFVNKLAQEVQVVTVTLMILKR
jgi:hypothetical protein